MGSFNGTCVVSGMPLQAGDKVRILLLTENPYDRHEAHRACHMHGWWVPRTFPIKGEYNDYGTVENVEPGVGQDLWLDTFKLDGIPQGTGDNTVHDVAVDFDTDFEGFLEALWEGRVKVSQRARRQGLSLAEQASLEDAQPEWLPTLSRVQAALADFPKSTEYGQEGFLVDALEYGVIRVRWVGEYGKGSELGVLTRMQGKLEQFATVITAGSGNYSHSKPELRVLPKPGPDRSLYAPTEDSPLRVSYAMIREDVWQALLQLSSDSVVLTRAEVTAAYVSEIGKQQRRVEVVEALKIAQGDTFDALKEELMRGFDSVPSKTLWIVDDRAVLGPVVGLSRQWRYLLEHNVPLEKAQDFLASVAEMACVYRVLANIRFIWRPSAICGPQYGDFQDHEKFFEAMLDVAHTKAIEQSDEDEGELSMGSKFGHST
jgi:hypothetical protein